MPETQGTEGDMQIETTWEKPGLNMLWKEPVTRL